MKHLIFVLIGLVLSTGLALGDQVIGATVFGGFTGSTAGVLAGPNTAGASSSAALLSVNNNWDASISPNGINFTDLNSVTALAGNVSSGNTMPLGPNGAIAVGFTGTILFPGVIPVVAIGPPVEINPLPFFIPVE